MTPDGTPTETAGTEENGAEASEAGTEAVRTELEPTDEKPTAVVAEAVAKPVDRRKFIAGGVAGAAVVGGAAYGLTRLAAEAPLTTHVTSARITKSVPVHDPSSPLWDAGEQARIEMDGQVFSMPMRQKPFVDSVKVRSVNDGDVIGFLLEWAVPVSRNSTVLCDRFRDGCAVLLAPPDAPEGVRMMGAPNMAVTIMQWKSDWQRDVDKGYQGVESAFPNLAFDYYPPLTPGESNVKGADGYFAKGVTQWLPGFAAGNPLVKMERLSPVEKLHAKGFGTAQTLPTQDGDGRGVWADGVWKVVIARPLDSVNEDEVKVEPGETHGMAVAVWAGMAKDRGGQKSPSKKLLRLHVEKG